MTSDELRQQVEAAVIEELERVGPEKFSKAELFARFKDSGASRATLYRWIDAPLKSGKAAAVITAKLRESAAARVEASPELAAAEAAAEAVEVLPVPRMEDIAGHGGTVGFVNELRRYGRHVEFLVNYARGTEDDRPRNSKLLAAALELRRRWMETEVRVAERMYEIGRVERMIDAIFEELKQESPELAERVAQRMNQLATTWGAV